MQEKSFDPGLKPELMEFSKIGESSLGYISVAEAHKSVPFDIKRVYWTYFTPNDVKRGGHAHRELHQIVFAVSGIITFNVEDFHGNTYKFELNQPHIGLYLPPLTWRDIQFSHNAALLCLASEVYEEKDYFRSYSEYREWKSQSSATGPDKL